MMPIDQANGLADLLTRAPLAGFLALTLLVVGALFALLMREKAAHQATIREVVVLMGAISTQWTQQLDLQTSIKALLERIARKLDQARPRKSSAAGDVADFAEQPTNSGGRVSPITQSGYPNPFFGKPEGVK